jgi:hypothetical protein
MVAPLPASPTLATICVEELDAADGAVVAIASLLAAADGEVAVTASLLAAAAGADEALEAADESVEFA